MTSSIVEKMLPLKACFSQGLRGNLNISPIDFLGRSTHIIHQINDGPCALIAACKWNWLYFQFLYFFSSCFVFILFKLALLSAFVFYFLMFCIYSFFTTGNILLLKGYIVFEPHETVVSIEFLVSLVISLLDKSVKMKVRNSCKHNFNFSFIVLQPKVVELF
jgi:alanyl-tRNA synthetase